MLKIVERIRTGVVTPKKNCCSCLILARTSDDVAQAGATVELREGHAAELIGAIEIAHAMIAAVSIDDATKRFPRQMTHQPGGHQFANFTRHQSAEVTSVLRCSRGHLGVRGP